jgi:anti-anti-sigma factor
LGSVAAAAHLPPDLVMGNLEMLNMTERAEEIGKNESLRVSLDSDGAVIAEGDIDLAGGPLLDAAILRVEGPNPIVIDLGSVEFIDSSGLRSLLAASRRAETRGTKVVLRNPTSGVVRLLSITGTAEQFDIQPALDPESDGVGGASASNGHRS